MRFSSLLDRTESKELTQEAAAELLGINVRTFQRWAQRYEAEGDDGLVDLRMGRRSPRRAPEEELERMVGLFRDKYADFTVKHFHEQLQKRHGYVLGYTVTKLSLHAAGLVRKAPKRSAHRKRRPRRPLRGMLLHQDGSRHVWIEGLPAMDLIVTLIQELDTLPRARAEINIFTLKKADASTIAATLQQLFLGTGSGVKRAVVIDDANLGETIAVRQMVYLALTYDHRLVDGADAARFLSDVKARLEAGQFEV